MDTLGSTPTPAAADNAIEVTLPRVAPPGEPLSPPVLVSFRETRSDGNIPHMYQARLIISSINGVPQDPRTPPPIEHVLDGEFATPFALRTADKLWFLFGDMRFKPEADGSCFRFAVQLWACWYDKTVKSWESAIYQCEVETDEIVCDQTGAAAEANNWVVDPDVRAWDITQVESVRTLAVSQPAATLGELSRKFRKITVQPYLLIGPWASPDRPSRRTG